jgi:hypothetical protein
VSEQRVPPPCAPDGGIYRAVIETYIARLLAHYNTHKALNVANAIDPGQQVMKRRGIEVS